jgi:hypothetical protein
LAGRGGYQDELAPPLPEEPPPPDHELDDYPEEYDESDDPDDPEDPLDRRDREDEKEPEPSAAPLKKITMMYWRATHRIISPRRVPGLSRRSTERAPLAINAATTTNRPA